MPGYAARSLAGAGERQIRRPMLVGGAGVRSKGLDTVTLYTRERMVEALSFDPVLGYIDTGRRVEQGDARVYLRKTIAHEDASRALHRRRGILRVPAFE